MNTTGVLYYNVSITSSEERNKKSRQKRRFSRGCINLKPICYFFNKGLDELIDILRERLKIDVISARFPDIVANFTKAAEVEFMSKYESLSDIRLSQDDLDLLLHEYCLKRLSEEIDRLMIENERVIEDICLHLDLTKEVVCVDSKVKGFRRNVFDIKFNRLYNFLNNKCDE